MEENNNVDNTDDNKTTSKVLIKWETKDNKKKIVFPKSNCACRDCSFANWHLIEFTEEQKEVIELKNYCHNYYTIMWTKDTPNVLDCDGKYKAKE